MHRPGIDQLAGRLAADIALFPKHFLPRDLDVHDLGQGVDHGTANPMQSAGGRVGLAAKFTARMQRGKNNFQCTHMFEFWVWIHWNAAPIVPHRQHIVRFQRHLDEAGMTGHRLVHGVIENLGCQVMKGGFIRAADIHPRPAAHRFQPLENLDILGGIGSGCIPI